MPTQYPFGKPYPRVLDPKPSGVANPQGLYRWSAFYAPLTTFTGDALAIDSTLAGDSVSLLLFTADIPVICRLYIFDNNTRQYNLDGVANAKTLLSGFVVDAPGGSTAVTVSNYGEVLKGYAGVGQAVSVSGFAAVAYQFIIAPLSATVTAGVVQAGTASSVSVECIANGAVATGVVGVAFPGIASFSTTAPTPVILRTGDYTQAIKDNDNLIVAADGKLAQVVGLYYNT